MRPFGKLFRALYHIVGAFTRIFHPVTVEGLENLPEHGALLCPNHSSNRDPVLLVLALPIDYHLWIMAKEELFRIPVINRIIERSGAFPVNRGGTDIQSVKTAIQAIKGGDNLLVFSEGTVVCDGIGHSDGLPAHARSGVAVIGVRTGATMIPVFMDGRKRIFRKTRIIIGKPVVPEVTGRRVTAEEMQKIADDLLEQAYALGGQAVGGAPL